MKQQAKLLGYFIDRNTDNKNKEYFNILIEINKKLYIHYIDKTDTSIRSIKRYLDLYNSKEKGFSVVSRHVPEHVLKRLKSEILKEDI